MSVRLTHGGRLNASVQRWQIPRDQWLDLSTGINPQGWPVPSIPDEIWRRLPEDDDGLEDIVRAWARVSPVAGVLPVPGSQAAIQALPRLRRPGRVGVPAPGYMEHGQCWAAADHEVTPLEPDSLEEQLDEFDVVVWIQPNNPTGKILPKQRLLQWFRRLARRGGWLVVDEAFIDGLEGESLAAHAGCEGLVILRSLGKFFGLAGVRAGAVLAWPWLCAELNDDIGPWALGGPTRYLMAEALRDTCWQRSMAAHLRTRSRRLADLLLAQGLGPSGGTLLFQYVINPEAQRLAEALARQGVLVRVFNAPSALRFGLPGPEPEWEKLRHALAACSI